MNKIYSIIQHEEQPREISLDNSTNRALILVLEIWTKTSKDLMQVMENIDVHIIKVVGYSPETVL